LRRCHTDPYFHMLGTGSGVGLARSELTWVYAVERGLRA